MTTKNIFAVGRIRKGNIKIHAAPRLERRAIAAARWFGQQDAAGGQWCSPGKYFSDPEMQAAYRAGYAEIVGATPATAKHLSKVNS